MKLLPLAPRVAILACLLTSVPDVLSAIGAEPVAVNIETTPDSTATPNAATTLTRPEAVVASLTIFVLALFVGFEMITKVPPTLHTPLMSGSNAISGITIVGAILVSGTGKSDVATWLGLLAVVFAMINVVGGFWVTHRMLSMFQRK